MFISGHGEGWALYAERLMDELGYFEQPHFYLGYLRAQAFRAMRVVLDIGVHTGLVPPPGAGERWTYDTALAFKGYRCCSSFFPKLSASCCCRPIS